MSERPAHESEDVEIVDGSTESRIEAVRTLLSAYATGLATEPGAMDVLAVQGFEHELASLPGSYAPPRGALRLILVNGQRAGCVALQPVDAQTAEIKRLFVDPAYRGMSLGHKLVDDIITQAMFRSYQRVVLDTLPFMWSAIRLYRSFDFEEIPNYRPNPMPGARAFARTLVSSPTAPRLVTYTPAMREAFEALNRQWLEEFFRVEEKDVTLFRDPQHTIVAPGGEIFFVVEGEEVVGTCAAIRHPDSSFELAKMAVASTARGRGYGQWLANAVISYARSQGARRIWLLSDEKLPDALRLYERAGFVRAALPSATGYARGDVFMEQALQ